MGMRERPRRRIKITPRAEVKAEFFMAAPFEPGIYIKFLGICHFAKRRPAEPGLTFPRCRIIFLERSNGKNEEEPDENDEEEKRLNFLCPRFGLGIIGRCRSHPERV
jgi:hypothetical protein